jgi:threonyl-tRNA synthetase
MENTTDYRDEKNGELSGLSRVRALTQDDSHVFCTAAQVEDEISNLIHCVRELYGTVKMELSVRLSYRDDSDAYLGEKKLWETAQKQLKSAVKAAGLDYFEEEGEAAFYGPKIDFMATDAIGRKHQVATIQLDFVQPERFELEYFGEGGKVERPLMIHHATLGSIERFLSIFIEHTAGKFPVWCAPEQLRLIVVKNDDAALNKFVEQLAAIFKAHKIRYTVDQSNNSVGKKIRGVASDKVPYSVVIGEKEVAGGKLSVRVRDDLSDYFEATVEELARRIAEESSERSK